MIHRKNIISAFKKIKRFGIFIPVSNILLVYGEKIFPKGILKRVSSIRNQRIERYIESCVEYPEISLGNCPHNSDKIWVLWLQGEEKMPLIPKMCLKSIRKHAGSHEVVLLSLANLDRYYELPKRIKDLYDNGNITAAHLSDIIRVGLLSTYGGFWIDSTMFLTRDIDESIFKHEVYSMKSKPEGYYVSKCRWAGFCLYMNRNSPMPHILKSMLNQYWEKNDWLIDYFILDYLIDMAVRHYPGISELMDKIPFNNPNLHSLSPVLCDQYDSDLFESLTNNTSFFKLSWKRYNDKELLSEGNNFYNVLNNSCNKQS